MTAAELITSAASRASVGPDLCQNKDWLATATGYSMEYALNLRWFVPSLMSL